jgi:uncharacterized membrane protein
VRTLFPIGRSFLAISIAFFGLQYLLYGRFVGGLLPVPPWAAGGRVGAYLAGLLLIATGAGLLLRSYARLSALIIGAFFLACVFLLHTWHLHSVLYDGTDRTRALEPLALGAVALVLASMLSGEGAKANDTSAQMLSHMGRILFALCLLVFGWQHFLYATFIKTLIPAWIPGHLFWTYFTGAAFIAVGLALLVRIAATSGSLLLGLMFLLWFLLLHIPRVVADYRNGDEWSSAFVALAMCGACWILAAEARKV